MMAGKLDRRITLRRATTSTDAMNEPVQTWADLATVWAARVQISNSEKFHAGALYSDQTIRFQIRYSSTVADLDTRDRLMFDGQEYDINGVDEIGRRVGLEITATARAETP